MTDWTRISGEGHDDGSTVLSPEEVEHLIPDWINSRSDLNQAEAAGILSARVAHLVDSHSYEQVLDDIYLKQIHREMFDQVWTWAGQYRKRELNLGVSFFLVPTSIRELMQSTKYRVDLGDEIDILSAELHHRLVSIHPFLNGNGRHARFFVDLFRKSLGAKAFTWGGIEVAPSKNLRQKYLLCLREADIGNINPLVEFIKA